MKKTFRFYVKFVDDDAPDLGMGRGLIGYQDVTFTLKDESDINDPLLLRDLIEFERKVLAEFVTVQVMELENDPVPPNWQDLIEQDDEYLANQPLTADDYFGAMHP